MLFVSVPVLPIIIKRRRDERRAKKKEFFKLKSFSKDCYCGSVLDAGTTSGERKRGACHRISILVRRSARPEKEREKKIVWG